MLHRHPACYTYITAKTIKKIPLLKKRVDIILSSPWHTIDVCSSAAGCRCLSFDNGLAGALHVATPTHPSSPVNGGEDDLSLVAALVEALLGPPTAQLPTAERSAAEMVETIGRGESAEVTGIGLPSVAAQTRNDCAVADRLPGIVLDEDSPFVGLFRDLGLERVCDADWVRFEPAAVCGAPSVAGFGGSGESPAPLSALALHP